MVVKGNLRAVRRARATSNQDLRRFDSNPFAVLARLGRGDGALLARLTTADYNKVVGGRTHFEGLKSTMPGALVFCPGRSELTLVFPPSLPRPRFEPFGVDAVQQSEWAQAVGIWFPALIVLASLRRGFCKCEPELQAHSTEPERVPTQHQNNWFRSSVPPSSLWRRLDNGSPKAGPRLERKT